MVGHLKRSDVRKLKALYRLISLESVAEKWGDGDEDYGWAGEH